MEIMVIRPSSISSLSFKCVWCMVWCMICMVYDDTSPYSPHVDDGLESLLPCNFFETKSSEEDCYEYKEDMDMQEHDAMDEDSPTSDMDGDDDY